MKYSEVTKLKKEDIEKLIVEKQSEIMNYRFENASNQLKDVKAISRVKKDIARLHTQLTALASSKGEA